MADETRNWTPGDRPDVDGPPPYGDSEFRRRLDQQLAAAKARWQRQADDRAAFKARRDAGKATGHRERLARSRGGHEARHHIDQLPVPPPEGAVMPMTAVEALDQVLRHFTERGHPGYQAVRTGWVDTDTLGRWHEALSAARHPSRHNTAWLDQLHLADGLRFEHPMSAADAVKATRAFIESVTTHQHTADITTIGDLEPVTIPTSRAGCPRCHPEENQ